MAAKKKTGLANRNRNTCISFNCTLENERKYLTLISVDIYSGASKVGAVGSSVVHLTPSFNHCYLSSRCRNDDDEKHQLANLSS